MLSRTRSAITLATIAVATLATIDAVPERLLAEQSSSASIRLSAQDTSLNINATNYSGDSLLATYTWPDNRIANAILMKFDLAGIPAGAVVENATLRLALVAADATPDLTYIMTVHKVVGRNPNPATATGHTSDGVTGWTPNACCYNNVPLAQADISLGYDMQSVDKIPGYKSWNVTAMVQEWQANPATNFGLLLNSDPSTLRDRYRYFASMEHPTVSLRPFLEVTYSAADTTPPSVAITAPASGTTVSGTVTVAANATDNVGVAGVQFRVDGAPLGAERTASPYTIDWDTTTASDGTHTLTAVARDGAGNTTTSAGVTVTVANGSARLSPQDTSLNLNPTNYSGDTRLTTYTWPDNRIANAILMKFDLAPIPAGAVVHDATLHLALVESDSLPDATYTVAAHKVVGRNPNPSTATGHTADGATGWTPNACCYDNVPLAQADISLAYDTRPVDKTPGDKSWTITTMVQEWRADPATNFGLLLNSDPSRLRDRYRYFASMEHPDANLRPFLHVTYSMPAGDTTPPSVSISSPAAGATVSNTVTVAATASDNVGVAGVRFKLDGANLGSLDTSAPYSVSWNTTTASNGSHTLTAVARDAAGNQTTSSTVTVTVSNGSPPPPPPSSGWTHQPPGFAPWAESSLDAFTGNGWNINNGNGYATIVADSAAPHSSPNLGRWRYPSGFAGGEAPATMYHPLPSTFNEGFVGVWWKPSNPWQGHSSNVNKIYFLLGGACGNLIPVMYGPPGGPYQLRVAPEWGNWNWLTPNVNAVPIGLGAWHKIELYFKYNTSGNGIIRWWMDDTLIGDYTNITFPSSGCFDEFQFSPTWGGVGDVKTQTDYFWYDHAYVSVPSGAPSADTTPPTVSVTAPSSGSTVSGSAVTVSASASDNVAVAGVQFRLDGANLGTEDTTAPYSVSWNSTTATNGSHTLTAVARDTAGNQRTSTGITVTVSNGSPPPPGQGTILFQEAFEDANLASRGWYDNTAPLLSTTEHVANSVRSIEYRFPAGATTPTAGSAVRRQFAASDSVYLSYYVKYSANWVGSQRPYHPHEFHFLTNLEGDWSGLSFTHLTAYIEQNGGTPLVGIQDGANVDQGRVGQDLTAVTEQRGVAGCNGSSDGYPDNCYQAGGVYVNEKKWRTASQLFTDTPGPFHKNAWHFIEVYITLNSVSGGKGVNDGVIQYWFDGQLVIDRHDVLLRTGANETMRFNQFVIAPYIGDGSPVTQSLWIDNLTVATARP